MNDYADGFLGSLLAIEGIADARAVINGPNGCRGYSAYLSDRLYPRDNSLNRRYFEELFFFGQSRIPCTYLDAEDYIAGSTGKLTGIMPLIAAKGDSLVAIVNSPGASLIGDDLNRFLREAGLEDRCMAFEGAGYSEPVSMGSDGTQVAVLRWLRLHRLTRIRRRVNLLGLSLYHRNWEGNLAELLHLCELMGLDVVSGWTGSTVADLRESPTAMHNLVIFPEFAGKTAAFYEKEFGIPAVISPAGAPVGFDATETWIRTVAEITGGNPVPALEYLSAQRNRAFHAIGRFSHEAAFIKGTTFGIRATISWVLPLVTWLYSYLNMLPVCIEVLPGGNQDQIEVLHRFLAENHLEETMQQTAETTNPDFFFSEGIEGKHLVAAGTCRSYLDLSSRMYTGVTFTEKTFLGAAGSLEILEFIFTKNYKYLYKE